MADKNPTPVLRVSIQYRSPARLWREPIFSETAEYNQTKEAPPKAGGHPRHCDPPKRDRHLPEKLPLHFGFLPAGRQVARA